MKKMALVITALLWLGFLIPISAQSPVQKMFEKYNAGEGFTVVSINKDLFNLLVELGEENESTEIKEVHDVIEGLDNISILMYDAKKGSDPSFLASFRKELESLKLKDFSELMMVKEQDEEVKFLIRKEGEKINELLLLVNQVDEAGFISITGDIDIKSIAKISRTMNIQGLENLEKINEEAKEE
ncbi:MAG TPA: DUF4252 domain-containing protein [Bacteroidales bacterium]|nr:DUF4252 domain-containing protein [Bacteroidales bacterium]